LITKAEHYYQVSTLYSLLGDAAKTEAESKTQRQTLIRSATEAEVKVQDLTRQVAELTSANMETADKLRRALARVEYLEQQIGPTQPAEVTPRAAMLETKKSPPAAKY